MTIFPSLKKEEPLCVDHIILIKEKKVGTFMFRKQILKVITRRIFKYGFVLFDLILYIPVNNFSVMLGWDFLC